MIYKRNKHNKLIYPSDGSSERYERVGDREIYISDRDIQVYAFDSSERRQIYAVDNGVQYYGRSKDKDIYAVDLVREFEYFVSVNGQDLYCKNKVGDEYYPRSLNRREKVGKIDGEFHYAKRKSGLSFYPRDERGDEFSVGPIVTDSKGLPVAPRKKDGSVNYSSVGGKEVLYRHNDRIFFGRNLRGDEQYPTDASGSQYYPEEGKVASDSEGFLRYALDVDKKIVYPMRLGAERYILDSGGSFGVLKRHSEHFQRYIIVKGRSVYPVSMTKVGGRTEMLMGDLYAKDGDGTRFYPKDSAGNEYVNSKGDLLDLYPVTGGGDMIIPNMGNEPLVGDRIPGKIKFILYRADFRSYDFLLRDDGSNRILDYNIFKKRKLNYVVTAACTLLAILIFLIVLFFK